VVEEVYGRMNMKDSFKEFTIFNYRRLLCIAKERFRFITYDEVYDYLNNNIPFVLWRHDVDYSLERARCLAETEREIGVKSTYFILIHSEGYNVFERESFDIVREIFAMGHDIALHFDPSFYGILDEEELNKKVEFEKNFLEFIGVKVKAISLHNPNPDVVNYNKYTIEELADKYPQYFRDKICKLINTYGMIFRKEIYYNSDSNGYWRFRKLEYVLTDGNIKKLQVLTHPEWWMEEALPPRKRIERVFFDRAERNMERYDKLLKICGRRNIDD
jgi:hypothetical protein